MRLTLRYDGTDFHGWQVQPETRTVQAELERVLSRICDRPTRATAAGRTDAGVHASGQIVSTHVPARWEVAELRKSLNALLPEAIRVADVRDAAPDFHARFSAVARGYVYRVGLAERASSPFERRYCWPLAAENRPVPLRREALDDAAKLLLGARSFAAFAKAGQEERGDRCTVQRSAWSEWRSGLQYVVVADRFLHHMVRYLVGTMVEVARARRPVADIARLLAGEGAVTTSPPAPARGLFLARVYYEAPLEDDPIDEALP